MSKRPMVTDPLLQAIVDLKKVWNSPDIAWEDSKALMYAVLLKHGWRAPRGR